MKSVLGVSVGASAVRSVCLDAVSLGGLDFWSRAVDTAHEQPEALAAESIGNVLAERADIGQVQAIGVAYRDQAQADAVQAAMARQQLGNYQLVPEVTAALRSLEVSGELGDHSTLVFYDLGSSGLTVTVVERSTGMEFGTARTDQISGDLVDRLIRDHQLELQRIAQPADAAAQLALVGRCRHAKEQLSSSGAVCVPGDGGLLLLSQDIFDSLIAGPVEDSARLAREVIDRSGRIPDAVVLIGGGARIPLVRSVMESWLNLPVIVPEQPELVVAEGAALLAEPVMVPVPGPAVGAVTAPLPVSVAAQPQEPPEPEHEMDAERAGAQSSTPAWLSVVARSPAEKVAKLQIRGAALAGGALAVAAAIGLGLGLGGSFLQDTEGDARPVMTQPSTQAPIVQEAAPPTTHHDARPPAPADQTEQRIRVPAPAPAPAPPPPPPPGPIIPGLPQIQLPPLQLPELPRIPGL